MKAICVTPDRELEVRDLPKPRDPPLGHLVVRVEPAINHGDKTFPKRPEAAGPALARSGHDVWGASAAGEMVAAGQGVPEGYVGRRVAIYRSLGRGPDTGAVMRARPRALDRLPAPAGGRGPARLERLAGQRHHRACLSGGGDRGGTCGVLATTGNSATGHALAALARQRGVPALILVRSNTARIELEGVGVADVLRLGPGDEGLEEAALRAVELGAKAVFDGVGGGALSRLLPHVAQGPTVYAYGFLAGAEPVSFPSALLMGKDLTLKRFITFETPTVRDPERLRQALLTLEAQACDPLLLTRVGRTFSLKEVDVAMAYEPAPGAKAVLIP